MPFRECLYKNALTTVAEDERTLDHTKQMEVLRCIPFSNPAILKSGPVALRHQISLALPFRRQCSSFVYTPFFAQLLKCMLYNKYIAATKKRSLRCRSERFPRHYIQKA
jgi:hypothetical protein